MLFMIAMAMNVTNSHNITLDQCNTPFQNLTVDFPDKDYDYAYFSGYCMALNAAEGFKNATKDYNLTSLVSPLKS